MKKIWQVWYADSETDGLTTTTMGATYFDHEAAEVMLLEQLEENGIEVEWLEVVRIYPLFQTDEREALTHNLAMQLWESSPETIVAILNLLPSGMLSALAKAAARIWV